MASSKQDYVAAAALFRAAVVRAQNLARTEHKLSRAPLAVRLEVERIAREFADHYGRTNERFDRERFLSACGVPDRKDKAP